MTSLGVVMTEKQRRVFKLFSFLVREATDLACMFGLIAAGISGFTCFMRLNGQEGRWLTEAQKQDYVLCMLLSLGLMLYLSIHVTSAIAEAEKKGEEKAED